MWKNIEIDMEKRNGAADNEKLMKAEHCWNQTPAAIGI